MKHPAPGSWRKVILTATTETNKNADVLGFVADKVAVGSLWIKLDPFAWKDRINISDISWDTKREVLDRELNKLGIFLHQKIQYSPTML